MDISPDHYRHIRNNIQQGTDGSLDFADSSCFERHNNCNQCLQNGDDELKWDNKSGYRIKLESKLLTVKWT